MFNRRILVHKLTLAIGGLFFAKKLKALEHLNAKLSVKDELDETLKKLKAEQQTGKLYAIKDKGTEPS